MSTCKDCKWWDRDRDWESKGYCHLISSWTNRERPKVEKAELRGYDKGELWTEPDFSCGLIECSKP